MQTHRLILALCLLAAFPAAARPRQAGLAQGAQGVSMTVEVGYDQRCVEGTWLPVRAVLENKGAQIDGHIEVRLIQPSGDPVIYRAPVSLPTISRKEVTVFVFPQGYLGTLNVYLMDGQQELIAARSTVNCLNPNDYLSGVIAGNPSGFGALNDLPVDNGSAYTLSMDLSDIPERSLALAGLDVLIFSDVDTGQLSNAQRQALSAWVAKGGQLLVAGGPGWQKTAAGLEELLPLLPTGAQTIDDLQGLADFALEPSGDLDQAAVAATGDLAQEAVVLASAGDLPLVVRRAFGAGSVIFLAVDPSLPPLRSWDRAARFYHSILSVQPELPGWNGVSRNWDLYHSAAGSVPALNLPSVFLVCGFLALYVLIAGPLHYMFLKRRKRNELAWITLPALVIFFSGMTFVLGNMVRGNRPILNRLAIVQVYPQAELAWVDGVIGLFSPARARYQLQTGPEFLVHPLPSFNERPSWNITASTETAALENLQVEVGGMLPIGVEGTIQAPEIHHNLRLVIDSETEQVHLEGQVTNQSDLTLTDAVLLAPGTTITLGEFRPGEERQVDLVLDRSQFLSSTGNNPSVWSPSSQVPPNVFVLDIYDTTVEDIVGSGAYYEDQATYRRYNLVSAALNSFGQVAGRGGGIYLSGWADSSPFTVGLRDRNYDTIDTTLYLVALNAPVEGQTGQLSLPPGLFTWATAGSTSYSTVSPYEMSMAAGTTATFSFKLAQPVAYRQVTGLTLHLQSGSSSLNSKNPEVGLWDFTAEEYQVLESLVWGDNEIPDPARFVGPGGLIRVFLKNEQTAGQIYLDKIDFTLLVER